MFSQEFNRITTQERNLIEQFQNEAPVKLSKLAQSFGIDVMAATLPVGVSGELRPASDGRYLVKVNRHDSKRRQRFTVAHEIAHYLLHRDQIGTGIVDDVLYRSSLSDGREAEANRLAADILMPRSLIEKKMRDAGNDLTEELVQQLASDFEVSDVAMRIRLGL